MVKTSPKESRERNGEKPVWNPAVFSSAPPPKIFIRAYSEAMFRVFFKEKLRIEVNCNFYNHLGLAFSFFTCQI